MAETGSIEYVNLLDNYIYISHIGDTEQDKYFILPSYPDQVSDKMDSQFAQTNSLARTAPVFTYSHSGPREVQFSIDLHRDLMDDVNMNKSNETLRVGEDYIDALIRALQAVALPKYNLTNKLVEPPMVALRLTDEIFIRGVVSGSVGVTYKKPILTNGRYAQVSISFTIYEVDPYDATTVYKNGGFRGITRTMKEGFETYKENFINTNNNN